MKYTIEVVQINKLKNNKGQIPGVPKNPRFIKDPNYAKLKQSIVDDPEMIKLREIIAYKHDNKLIVIAGNMRLRACKELGYTEVPVKIVEDLEPERIRAIIIKDNVAYGTNDYDLLANEWDMVELEEWGVALDPIDGDNSAGDEDSQKQAKMITCPACLHEFNSKG